MDSPGCRFWECPNGNKTCKYRHSLPPGYVLKSESKANKDADDEEKIPIEVEIEDEVCYSHCAFDAMYTSESRSVRNWTSVNARKSL